MLYQLHRLIAIAMVIANPVRLAAAIPVAIPATAHASATTVSAPHNLTFDTTRPQPVAAEVATLPNFDTEVEQPLQAAQAAAAQAAAAQAQAARLAARAAVHVAVAAPATGDAFAKLRYCEAGGDYTRNSGNGYYGAYQYSLSSWGNYGGYARPDLAPAAVQDAKAAADQAVRGWSPWPACSRQLGL